MAKRMKEPVIFDMNPPRYYAKGICHPTAMYCGRYRESDLYAVMSQNNAASDQRVGRAIDKDTDHSITSSMFSVSVNALDVIRERLRELGFLAFEEG